MPDRKQLLQSILTAGFATIGIAAGALTVDATAGTAATIGLAAGAFLGNVASDWTASQLLSFYDRWTANWFTQNGALHPDLYRALVLSFQRSVRQIELDWQSQPHYKHLACTDEKAAELTLLPLNWLREDGDLLIERPDHLPTVLRTDDAVGLMNDATNPAKEQLNRALASYLYGHDRELVVFVCTRFMGEWELRFYDILFAPDDVGTRAWRTFQHLQQQVLVASIAAIGQDTSAALQIVQRLEEWATRLSELPVSVRELTGDEVLREARAQASDRLDRLQSTGDRINETTTRIEDKVDQLLTQTRVPTRKSEGRDTMMELQVKNSATATIRDPYYDVFMCCNEDDGVEKRVVESIATRLRESSIKPWFGPWHRIPGEPHQEATEKALEQCGSVAVFLGPSGIGPWQNEQMRVAIERRVESARAGESPLRVIPVLLPSGEEPARKLIPSFLSRATWVEYKTGPDDPEAQRALIAGIRGEKPVPAVSTRSRTYGDNDEYFYLECLILLYGDEGCPSQQLMDFARANGLPSPKARAYLRRNKEIIKHSNDRYYIDDEDFRISIEKRLVDRIYEDIKNWRRFAEWSDGQHILGHVLIPSTRKQGRDVFDDVVSSFRTEDEKNEGIWNLEDMLDSIRNGNSPKDAKFKERDRTAVHNILQLLSILKNNDLGFQDLSYLPVKKVDFRNTRLPDTYAQRAEFQDCMFRQTFGSVSSLAVSPDRLLVAMGANNGEISLWRGPEMRHLLFATTGTGHIKTVRSLRFVKFVDEDDLSLVSAGDDGRVYKWTINEGKGFTRLSPQMITQLSPKLDRRVLCATPSPDGRWIVIGEESGQLHYVDTASDVKYNDTDKGTAHFQYDDWIVSAEFLVSAPNQCPPWTMVTGSQNGKIDLWRVTPLGNTLGFRHGSTYDLQARLRIIVPDPRGLFFLCGDENGTISLFDVEQSTNKAPRISPSMAVPPQRGNPWGRVWCLAMNPSATLLASGTDDGTLRVWHLDELRTKTGRTPVPFAKGKHHTDRIWSVAFLDDARLVTGGDDQLISRWELKINEQGKSLGFSESAKSIEGYSNRIWSLAAFPKTDTPLTDVLIYAGDFRDVREIPDPDVHRIRFYHRREGHLGLNVPRGGTRYTLTGRVEVIRWNRAGTRLAVASHDGRINILECSKTNTSTSYTWKYREPAELGSDWGYAAAWHPERDWLLYGTRAGKVSVWNLKDDGSPSLLWSSPRPVRAVAFSRDGQVLAASTEGGEIACWTLKPDSQCYLLARWNVVVDSKPQPIRSLAFFPENLGESYWLVSGDDSKTIRVWSINASNGAVMQEQVYSKQAAPNSITHADRIRAIDFSPGQGHVMVSGDDNGDVIVWLPQMESGSLTLSSLGVLLPKSQGFQFRNEEPKISRTHVSQVRAISFFPDGDLATCCEAEEESVILWNYRYKNVCPPQEATVANTLFEKRRIFHARRLYEGLDYTGAEFDSGASDYSARIEKQLKYLGAIEVEDRYGNEAVQQRQVRMRAGIQAAVEEILGPCGANTAEWATSATNAIIEGMKHYLCKYPRSSSQSRKQWADNLGDYERRLRVLLNKGRKNFWLVRHAREEEDVARFLLRLCLVLRLKAEEENKVMALNEEEGDLEEILLSDLRSPNSPRVADIWTGNYYAWPFVWDAIDPGHESGSLPEHWRSKFGKRFGKYFLAQNAPFRQDYGKPPIPDFDGEDCITFNDPDKPDERSINIASTVVDDKLRYPGRIISRWNHEEFAFRDPHLQELQMWMKQELATDPNGYDGTKARVIDIEPAGDNLLLTMQPIRYSCYCVTNLPISLRMQCIDPDQCGELGRSMLDWLCPRNLPENKRRLPKLGTSELSNHLGVNCIVITSDGFLLMYRRLPDEVTDPDTVGFAPSIAMKYFAGEIREPMNTPQHGVIAAFHELGPSITLDGIHPDWTIENPLLYLGTFREWARGGKPEMYFLTCSTFSLDYHQSRAHSRPQADQAHAVDRFERHPDFRLYDGDFTFRVRRMSELRPLDVRRRLWSLVNKQGGALQESAKAGIYLLANAYETNEDMLREFFAQFERQP